MFPHVQLTGGGAIKQGMVLINGGGKSQPLSLQRQLGAILLVDLKYKYFTINLISKNCVKFEYPQSVTLLMHLFSPFSLLN